MSTYDPGKQRLFFDDLINCRDLGGMRGSGGRVFKNNIILRSGSPSLASDKAYRELKQYGVKTVIDLRSEAEVGHYGNPFREDEDTAYYNIPLFLGDPDADEDPTMNYLKEHPMGDFYVLLLKNLGPRIVDVMDLIAERTDGIILIHCAHGKDRTGVIAALLYLLIGASREDIVLNYKVSYEYARHLLDPLIEAKEPALKHTLRSDAVNMEIMLDYMDKEYGMSARSYLLGSGMPEERIDRLINRII